jgi:hypothetical protein
MEYPLSQYYSTPVFRFWPIVFVRLIACQEQVDSICSAKLYALVAATSQLGKSGPVLLMEVPYEQAG